MKRAMSIALALHDYLRKRRRKRISEQLNQVYANAPSPDERRLVEKLRRQVTLQDRW